MNPDYLHPELFPKNFSPNLTNPDHQLARKAPIIATEIDFAGENLGEFNLPVSVSTQIANENSQNLQSSVFDLLDGVQGLTNYGQNVSLLTKFDQKVGQEDYCWSETSSFLEGQIQEDEVTLVHLDPSLVTGQVILSFNSQT